jgi:hypothetical protein
MYEENQQLDTLQDIKNMMERSSKFISLSGWSGIAAGLCGLIGAGIVFSLLRNDYGTNINLDEYNPTSDSGNLTMIMATGIIVFVAALISVILFTYLRSKKTGVPMWGTVARRLIWNTGLPVIIGAFFVIRLIQLNEFGLIAPACLIFYGLGLINGSKYTFGEVRFLGYGEVLLGIINLWMIGYGLYFWAAGFGVLHIIYGIIMWNRYERTNSDKY